MQQSIFAMELCFRMYGDLHAQLKRALPDQVVMQGVGQKWQQYRRVAQILHDGIHLAEAGCWDYFDDHDRAERDFAMWKKGMTTAEGERAGPLVWSPNEPRYLTFTMAFLLAKDSPSDVALRGSCDVPEAMLWQRGVFARLLREFGQVSFASVIGDVSYLIPRDPDWALTAIDLTDPKFHYLRRLV